MGALLGRIDISRAPRVPFEETESRRLHRERSLPVAGYLNYKGGESHGLVAPRNDPWDRPTAILFRVIRVIRGLGSFLRLDAFVVDKEILRSAQNDVGDRLGRELNSGEHDVHPYNLLLFAHHRSSQEPDLFCSRNPC